MWKGDEVVGSVDGRAKEGEDVSSIDQGLNDPHVARVAGGEENASGLRDEVRQRLLRLAVRAHVAGDVPGSPGTCPLGFERSPRSAAYRGRVSFQGGGDDLRIGDHDLSAGARVGDSDHVAGLAADRGAPDFVPGAPRCRSRRRSWGEEGEGKLAKEILDLFGRGGV